MSDERQASEQARELVERFALLSFRDDIRDEMFAFIAALEADRARLDWIQETFDGTGHTLSMGGVCYWALDMQRGGRRSKVTRLGDGADVREAIDDAMSSSPLAPTQEGA